MRRRPGWGVTTQSGRPVYMRVPYDPSAVAVVTVEDAPTHAEIMAVGAGIGGGFQHSSELIPMKYEEAMSSGDAPQWEEAVAEEHQRMVDNKVFKVVPKEEVPRGSKVLTSTWAMKKKSNGKYRARVVARGYEQKPGEHYDPSSISSPVVNEASIFIIFILIALARMHTDVNDVKGAFLKGHFSNGEKIYMKVPQGFEKWYGIGVVLLLLRTLYGLKQAAYEYWRTLLQALRIAQLVRSAADPCVYYKWTGAGLQLTSSWIDDTISCCVSEEELHKTRGLLKLSFDLDECGPIEEYVGCKVEYNREEGFIKLTQPVLLQSFEDEFDLTGIPKAETPAAPGSVLEDVEDAKLDPDEHYTYRKGVGKLIHLSKYSRPEILNAVRELSRYGSKPVPAHEKAMLRVMKYCVETKNRGRILKPFGKWDGRDRNYKFIIHGEADSTFASDKKTRRSTSGWGAFLNGAAFSVKSKMQKFVTQSVTEAEAVAGSGCAADMIYGMEFLQSIGLQVELPMVLWMDNQGAVDLFNSWSVSGNTRHIGVRLNWMRELKEQGILIVKWFPGVNNSADMFTKNLDKATLEKHASKYIDLAIESAVPNLGGVIESGKLVMHDREEPL